MHFDQRTRLGRWLYRNQWVLPRNWFKARRARAAVLEATYVYLSDMLSFWEGEPCPGELRAKDLLCATLALQCGDYSGALGLVESSAKRAQFIAGARP